MSLKKSNKITSESYEKKSVYDSIDECPIWNWIQIQKTGNLGFLVIEGSFKAEELEQIYLDMNDQVFDKFGINNKFRTYISLLKEKCRLLSELIEEFDPFKDLDLYVIQQDIDALYSGEKQEFDEVVIIIEKFMGFQLDPKKISVQKYYSYLKTIEKHGKAD